jgi:hypothetical protein
MYTCVKNRRYFPDRPFQEMEDEVRAVLAEAVGDHRGDQLAASDSDESTDEFHDTSDNHDNSNDLTRPSEWTPGHSGGNTGLFSVNVGYRYYSCRFHLLTEKLVARIWVDF